MAKLFPNIPELRFGDNNLKPLLMIPKKFMSKQNLQKQNYRLEAEKIISINDFINEVECIVDEYTIQCSEVESKSS